MAVAVLLVHKLVVIDKILVAGVIRRIDVDNVNLALVRIGKGGQGFEVVSLNEDMVGRTGLPR